MRARWIALLSMTALSAGCSPRVTGEDGFYACNRSDECPREAPFCVGPIGERRCRRGLPDGGTPQLDGATPRPDAGGPCDCPEGLRCIVPGYCAPPCSGAACAGGDHCGPDGFCREGCEGDGECPGDVRCLFGRWADGDGSACVEREVAEPEEQYGDCDDVTCRAPLTCIAGTCTRPCTGTGAGQCLPTEICQPVPPEHGGPDVKTCLVDCGAGQTCPSRTMCRPAGTSGMRCIPDAWGGRT